MQQATNRGDMIVDVSCPDPRKYLVHRVRVGEDVVRCLPIGMFIGFAKARHSERRRVGKRSTKISRRSTGADRLLERIDNLDWVVTEHLMGERGVVRPA